MSDATFVTAIFADAPAFTVPPLLKDYVAQGLDVMIVRFQPWQKLTREARDSLERQFLEKVPTCKGLPIMVQSVGAWQGNPIGLMTDQLIQRWVNTKCGINDGDVLCLLVGSEAWLLEASLRLSEVIADFEGS